MTPLNINGLTEVPIGKIATIVTALEMTERPELTPADTTRGVELVLIKEPDLDWYRSLFRAIGTDWLWFSRLVLEDRALEEILQSPDNDIYAVHAGGRDIGLLELDFRTKDQAEVAFFGFIPEWTGKGLGGWMMREALRLAWRPDTTRVWIHTCTLDSPAALPFYQKQGFIPFARQVEIVDDPRLTGLLAREAAPQVPIIE